MYEGDWVQGMSEGRGTERYANGDEFDGEWAADLWEGRGLYLWADGTADSAVFQDGQYVGDGVRWSADRKRTWLLVDGELDAEITMDDARELTAELALRAPPPPRVQLEFEVHHAHCAARPPLASPQTAHATPTRPSRARR